MLEKELVKEAGLTDGEAKVYISLLELGESTTGPIIEKSKVARSFIYNILDNLMQKGLVSYFVKEGKKHYLAAEPQRILDYIEKRKNQLEESKNKISSLIPKFEKLKKQSPTTEIQIFEGFRGVQTCFEHYHKICKRGDETLTLGVPSVQEEKYHEYWQQDHLKRAKKGITNKMLFNKDTDVNILKNRNSYKGCSARYMPSEIKTPAWIFIYRNVSTIIWQDKKNPIALEIMNQQIADTFKAYFEDYWKNARALK